MLRKIHFCLLAGLIFTPAFSQQLGYIPFEKSSTAVSSTLEFAYDDWTIYQTALRAGNEEIAKQYYARALNYRNVFDKKNGFACPRDTDVLSFSLQKRYFSFRFSFYFITLFIVPVVLTYRCQTRQLFCLHSWKWLQFITIIA